MFRFSRSDFVIEAKALKWVLGDAMQGRCK